MSKPRKDELLKTPQYRGGMAALKEFIKSNLKYPKAAEEHKVEGAVEVAYDVDGLGKIRNVKVLAGIAHGCDEEVIRLVNLLVYEKAINKGKKTLTHKKLKIDFHLPKAQPPKPDQQRKVTYTITKPLVPTEANKQEQGGKSYTIKVNFNKK
jgi:hypothetical protein